MSLGLRARRALLGWIGFAVAGTPVQSAETSEVDRDLALLGFRKAARGFLLRRMAAAALREGEMTILSRGLGGRFVLASSGGDQGVGWEILERGTYEPHIVRFYERTLRPGMTVLDVGANIGFHALHVTIGLALLTTVLIFGLLGRVEREHAERTEVLSWYWHFVDAVWIAVFTVVYVIGR